MTDTDILKEIKADIEKIKRNLYGQEDMLHNTGIIEELRMVNECMVVIENKLERMITKAEINLSSRLDALEGQQNKWNTIVQFVLWLVGVIGITGILRGLGIV